MSTAHPPQDTPAFAVPSQLVHAGTCQWSSNHPQPTGPLTFWSILAPHIASVAKGLQELKEVGEVQLPRTVGLMPPWHLCNLDVT